MLGRPKFVLIVRSCAVLLLQALQVDTNRLGWPGGEVRRLWPLVYRDVVCRRGKAQSYIAIFLAHGIAVIHWVVV